MDIGWVLWSSVLGITSAIIFFLSNVLRRKISRLPPGPPRWPIVGNLMQLGNNPYQSLSHLATKYGPLMSLSLGMKTAVVVSSPAMAKEVLKTHDHLLAGRTVTQAIKGVFGHDKSSLVWSQLGSHWRMLRRISNTELFSVKRLEALQHLRRDQVFRTNQQILQECEKHKSINIGHDMLNSAVDLLGKITFGKDMFDSHSPAFQEFKDSIEKMMVNAGARNLADYFPFLQRLDPQGVIRNTKINMGRVYDILDKFITDRLAKRGKTMDGSDGPKDLLDALLDMRSDEFTVTDIRSYLTDIFGAGTHTTAKTMEWAMAEMICNPEKMKRAQSELDKVVGRSRRVEENDTDRLPYLNAVVKEVLRLHPVVPLMIPHRATSSCEIGGYLIPKDTQVIVNVWAIGRDPAIWNEASKFVPERFLDSEMSSVDYRGQHFELLPYGAGRRMCVGLPLASRLIHLVLASLIHSFDWEPPKGMIAEQMDMKEKSRLVMHKAVPLEAIPTPRLPLDVY